MNAILRRCNDGGDHGEKSRNEDPEGEASGSLTEKEMNAIFQFNKKVLGDKMLDGMPKKWLLDRSLNSTWLDTLSSLKEEKK